MSELMTREERAGVVAEWNRILNGYGESLSIPVSTTVGVAASYEAEIKRLREALGIVQKTFECCFVPEVLDTDPWVLTIRDALGAQEGASVERDGEAAQLRQERDQARDLLERVVRGSHEPVTTELLDEIVAVLAQAVFTAALHTEEETA